MDDLALLREYARGSSEEAFETLVSRYADLVYSAALRQVRDPSLAEEVTQAVFILLAQKAGHIRSGTILPGWLYSTTWFTARKALRSEQRRLRRESEAALEAMTDQSAEDSKWEKIAPVLDDAMMDLNEKDRNAVLLRFFKEKQFKEVGVTLGITEEAARKRVSRALELLRSSLAKRDVAVPSAVLLGLLSTKMVSAAPLASAAVAAGALKGTASAASTLALVKGTIKVMAWTKLKTALMGGAAVLFVAGTATVTITQHRALERNQKLYQEDIRRAESALSQWKTNASKRSNLPAAAVTNVVDWRMVDSPDYRKYIANMKAIGVPWETIKDIIFADVNKLYAQKAQGVGTPKSRNFWETERTGSASAEKERIEKLNRIEEERKGVLRELVGIESDEEIRHRLAWSIPSGPQLDFLTDEKRAQVQALDKYDLLRDALYKRVGDTWSKEDFAELKRIEAEKRNALMQFLTPEELEKYDLVTHPIAAQMRTDLSGFHPNEDEFRMIFANRKSLEDRFAELQMEAKLNPAASGIGLQMAAATDEAERELETQLGPARYADYKRSRDPEFLVLQRVSDQVGLSEETVRRAYQIKKDFEAENAALEQSLKGHEKELAASPPEVREQFEAKIASIEQNEEAALRQALGDDGFAYYKSFNVSRRAPVTSPAR